MPNEHCVIANKVANQVSNVKEQFWHALFRILTTTHLDQCVVLSFSERRGRFRKLSQAKEDSAAALRMLVLIGGVVLVVTEGDLCLLLLADTLALAGECCWLEELTTRLRLTFGVFAVGEDGELAVLESDCTRLFT